MKAARFWSIGLVAIAAACGGVRGDEAPAPAGRVSSAIQGGTATTSYPYVVSIRISEGAGVGQCSGALIAPNLVMTARHCVDDVVYDPTNPAARGITCGKTVFGAQKTAAALEVTTCANVEQCTKTYRASKILRTTGTAMCGRDMALVILAQNVPAAEATPITPAVQYPITDKRYGSQFTAIGYGITSPTAQDEGRRRILQSVPIVCIPGHWQPSRDCTGNVPAEVITPEEWIGSDGTCQGDSGSSAFEQNSFNAGTPLSFGVLSRGGEDQGKCVQSIWTRTDSMRDFLVAGVTEAAQRGGYALPAWTVPVAPPPDAGAPPADAGKDSGARPTQDAGGGATGAAGLGEACEEDGDCGEGICAARTGGAARVCAATCADDTPCASGYDCVSGACFLHVATPPDPVAQVTASGGCSVGATGEPGKPLPWTAGFLALGLLLAARARRRAAPLP